MSTVTSNYFTNYSSMCLKMDHWGCNFLAFDREINVLLCKDDSTRGMLVVIQDVIYETLND